MSVSLTIPASSAAVAVIIFIVEPGGWSAENPTPATPRIAPLRGSMATMPAYWLPMAVITACSIRGIDRRLDVVAGGRGPLGEDPRPGEQLAPG